jgi:CheY-like chemotaxis protein
MDIFSLTKPSAAAPDMTLSQDTVLLVDDDDLHRSCLKEFLERRGYVCLEAVNGDRKSVV